MADEFQSNFSKTVDMKWFAMSPETFFCYSTRVFTYYIHIPLDRQSLSIYVKYVTKDIVVTGHGLKKLRI